VCFSSKVQESFTKTAHTHTLQMRITNVGHVDEDELATFLIDRAKLAPCELINVVKPGRFHAHVCFSTLFAHEKVLKHCQHAVLKGYTLKFETLK